jgi:hypothetical protein
MVKNKTYKAEASLGQDAVIWVPADRAKEQDGSGSSLITEQDHHPNDFQLELDTIKGEGF